MLHYPRWASVYACCAQFIQRSSINVGVLERGLRYYPYREACSQSATACIDGLGEQTSPLLIAFTQRRDIGTAIGLLRTDAEGYLYSQNCQQAIDWLNGWVAKHTHPSILASTELSRQKGDL